MWVGPCGHAEDSRQQWSQINSDVLSLVIRICSCEGVCLIGVFPSLTPEYLTCFMLYVTYITHIYAYIRTHTHTHTHTHSITHSHTFIRIHIYILVIYMYVICLSCPPSTHINIYIGSVVETRTLIYYYIYIYIFYISDIQYFSTLRFHQYV